MKEEIKECKATLKELGVKMADVRKITIKWEKVFSDKAFPKIEIELK